MTAEIKEAMYLLLIGISIALFMLIVGIEFYE
jgi:hypothetical protein